MVYSFLRPLAALVALLWLSGAAQAAGIRWARTYDEALKSVRASKKLLMIDFYADWCGYCKKLEAEVFPDPQVARLGDRFVAVRLNAEREGVDLAQKYGVAGLPTIVFVDAKNQMVAKIRGFLPAAPFAKRVQSILTIHEQLPALERQHRANPSDAATAAKLLSFYVQIPRREEALATLDRLAKADPSNRSGKLARAFCEVADLHYANRAIQAAQGYYQRALAVSRTPQEKAYAQVNVAFCRANLNDLAGARQAFQKTVAIAGCPADIKTEAKQGLAKIDQILR